MSKPAADHSSILEFMKGIVSDLNKAIGIPCEIVLHDYQNPNQSIVAISGDLTGRKVGGPLTGIALRRLRSGDAQETMIGYPATTPDGKPMRSSTLILRDENGEVFGSLCINIDLTYWEMLKTFSNRLCETKPILEVGDEGTGDFESGVQEILHNYVERAIRTIGKPVALMSKAEKMEITKTLDENGLFLIKGAIDYLADVLGVSRPTIYNYLAELRSTEPITVDTDPVS